MSTEDNVARRESILLPVLIVALGGAIAGGSYGLAVLVSDLGVMLDSPYATDMGWLTILPLCGGCVMGIAMSLALTRSGLSLRPSHNLSLLVIWTLGSGTMLFLLSLISSLTSVSAVQIAVLMPVIAGGLTGWATRRTIERVVGFRLEGTSLFVPWAAGFTMFVVGWFFFSLFLFSASLFFVGVDVMANIAILFLLVGFGTGGLTTGCSAWLMFRDVESALRRHSSVKPENTLDTEEHGAHLESSQPSAESR